MRNVLENMNVW